ncbi:MAG: alpha/beta hydrolase [Actinobacteria bacterium]|nr:alpha/beta hydrolase [Actinomycetota bacterium]
MPVPSPYAAALAAIPVREAAVEVLGSTTRYWEYGPHDRPVDLVLVHGYRGDHHGLEPIVSYLPGLHVVSPDLPGFGVSTATSRTHSIDGYVAWLAAFLDALGLTGTTLLGHSFGSIVVSHALAAGVPSPRLILVNPIAVDAMSGAGRIVLPLTRLYFRIGRALPERAAHVWLGNRLTTYGMSLMLARTRDRRLRRWIHEEHGRYFGRFSDPATLAEGYDASMSTNVIAAAPALTMPTLIVAGDVDSIAPLEGARRLAELLPDARLVVLHGVGHLIHYERPGEAAAAIRDFLGAQA